MHLRERGTEKAGDISEKEEVSDNHNRELNFWVPHLTFYGAQKHCIVETE